MYVRNQVTEAGDYLQPGARDAPGLWQYCTSTIDLLGVSLFREIDFCKDSVVYCPRALAIGPRRPLFVLLLGNFSVLLC